MENEEAQKLQSESWRKKRQQPTEAQAVEARKKPWALPPAQKGKGDDDDDDDGDDDDDDDDDDNSGRTKKARY